MSISRTSMHQGLVGFLLLACVQAASGQYAPGFVWNRFADYDAGVEAGANYMAGNPSTDALGNLVWSHEWCTGGDIDSTDPWWNNPAHLCVWDPAWFGSNQSLWAAGNDVQPPIDRMLLEHVIQTTAQLGRIPRVRWISPVAGSATVAVSGHLTVEWTGHGGASSPNTVDVVIGLIPRIGASSLLFSMTVERPANSTMLVLPVDIPAIEVSQGDSIVITARARMVQNGRWINLHDDQLNITLVSGGACPEDINGDGTVDLVDLARVLGAFGSICP